MRGETFYFGRLSKYFDAHYQEYTKTAEWYTNPAPNQWKFEIPGIGVVVLVCSDDGEITESITAFEDKNNE